MGWWPWTRYSRDKSSPEQSVFSAPGSQLQIGDQAQIRLSPATELPPAHRTMSKGNSGCFQSLSVLGMLVMQKKLTDANIQTKN